MSAAVGTGPTLELLSRGVAETQRLAGEVARLARAGDVILLDGDLGAGKTAFTQGFARALGVTDVVTSPTFTLLRSYPTDAGFDLYHADLYRLEQLSEVVDLGLPELLEDGGAAVIEWGERGAPALGPAHLRIEISLAEGEDARSLRITSDGGAWDGRWEQLRARLERDR